MKTKAFKLLIAATLLGCFYLTSNAQIPDAYLGKWKWNDPSLGDAATGYLELKKDTILVKYDAINEFITAYDLQVKSDSVLFKYSFSGSEVRAILVLDDLKKINAYATNDYGSFIVALIREE
ncbi:MAG TPA: hypothetical protein VK179_17420 [Bacteroidales bacterium]|nr:hypothetical protein [Bacteroidales bacterium]